MHKKGFWNLLGLPSLKNLQEIEEKLDQYDEKNENRMLKLVKYTSQKMDHVQEEFDSIRSLLTQINENLCKIDASIDAAKNATIQSVNEYDGILKDTDVKMEKILADNIENLEMITKKIENMDLIVNLSKIEGLLRLLVVNDMMDEMDKL